MAKRQIIPLFIPHLGCPNGCVFCDQKKITGQGAGVTPQMVAEEVKAGLKRAGDACEVAFYGGSFTAIPPEEQEALLQAVQPWCKTGEIGSIRVSTRPDAVDEETVRRLKRYGVTTVELGCQSMDEQVLRLSKRGHTPEDTRNAVRHLKAGGLQVILQMMTGLPGDDGAASVYTAEEIIKLKPDGVRIYPTVVLAGTELERMMTAGTYSPHEVETAVELCGTLYEKFLQAGIPVIRVGLNPTELLSGGGAVAGAYHPGAGGEGALQNVSAQGRETAGRVCGQNVCSVFRPSQAGKRNGGTKTGEYPCPPAEIFHRCNKSSARWGGTVGNYLEK